MALAIAHLETPRPNPVRTDLRSSLYAVSSDNPTQQSRDGVSAKLQTIADIARRQVAEAGALGGTAVATNRAGVDVTDAPIIELFRFARDSVEQAGHGVVSPVSCVAVGNYSSPAPRTQLLGGFLAVVERQPQSRARSEAVADFVTEELAEIGIEVEPLARAVDEASRLLLLPAFAGWLRQRRLIDDQHTQFACFLRRAARI